MADYNQNIKLWKLGIHVGPTAVKEIAAKFQKAGFKTVEGTERVIVEVPELHDGWGALSAYRSACEKAGINPDTFHAPSIKDFEILGKITEEFGATKVCKSCKHSVNEHGKDGCNHNGCKCMALKEDKQSDIESASNALDTFKEKHKGPISDKEWDELFALEKKLRDLGGMRQGKDYDTYNESNSWTSHLLEAQIGVGGSRGAWKTLKVIPSHVGVSRFYDECDPEPFTGHDRYVKRPDGIPSPYAFSAYWTVYKWNGKNVEIGRAHV